MTFFRFRTKLYPLIAITASLFVIVFGLVAARNENLCWYLLGVLAWLCIFGCFKGVLKMLPAFVVFGGKELGFGAPSPEYAEQIAELFGIKHLWRRHPQSLSEGQKRRVSIAAVVACQPEVLLLDEPTVGQDYDGLCQMVEILNKLHEQTGNTMITITHDVRCAEALCDRAYLIADGAIKKRGGKQLVREYFLGQSELCSLS